MFVAKSIRTSNMKLLVVCVVFFAGVALSVDTNLDISEKVFESEFNKRYGDQISEKNAAGALAAAEKQINEENKLFMAGKASFFEKLNANSDLPKSVFEKEKEGDINKKTRALGDFDIHESQWFTHPELERLYRSVELDRQSIPPAVDSTTIGLVTTAKNQMSCGSCAAFAVTGAHETCMLKGGARFNGLDLSEQYLLDCGYNGKTLDGCDGADAPSYGTFFAETLKGQSVHEVEYPYLDKFPKLTCPAGKKIYNSGAFVQSAMPDYFCTEDKLKTLVATYGAAVTSIYASDPAFGNYANGVFNGCSSNPSNHAVLVVGYGTDLTSKKDFWLVRNSWGSDWGVNGYIKIQRGIGQCNIGKKCYAAKCSKSTGTVSDPPIIPPPPPIPASQECDMTKSFGPVTGSYGFTFGKFESQVKCVNGICRPAIAGPSNACMYICGKLTC